MKGSSTVLLFVCTCRCLEEGLLPSLSYRNMSRLYATASLVGLTLPPAPSPSPSSTSGTPGGTDHGMARLQAVCRDNKMEENLNNLAEDLDAKEFAISPGWLIVARAFVVTWRIACRGGWSFAASLSLAAGDGYSHRVRHC